MQALNQVVLWDKIVLRGDNPKLLLKDMKTKYFFFDDGNGLKWVIFFFYIKNLKVRNGLNVILYWWKILDDSLYKISFSLSELEIWIEGTAVGAGIED